MRAKRSRVLSLVLVVAFIIVFCARRIYEYAAAPAGEKESDFIFPADFDQQRETAPVSTAKPQTISFEQLGGYTNDASHLNKTEIYGVVHVTSEEDIRSALQYARDNHLKVTCAGQQHSMGGQTFTRGGLVLDLRDFNRIDLDKERKRINVQSGARWWQVQQRLDKASLSVKAMQSIEIRPVPKSMVETFEIPNGLRPKPHHTRRRNSYGQDQAVHNRRAE